MITSITQNKTALINVNLPQFSHFFPSNATLELEDHLSVEWLHCQLGFKIYLLSTSRCKYGSNKYLILVVPQTQ